MFMKSTGELNFATSLTLPAPNTLATKGYQRGGAAFLDAPNLMCALTPLVGRRSVGVGKLDLARLRTGLQDLFCVGRFEFVIARHPHFSRALLRDVVRNCRWNYVEVHKPRFGWDITDPVDDHIREMISRQVQNTRPSRTIALASHDGGFAPVLEYALDEGWKLVVVGLVEQMSHRLKQLKCSQLQILDLQEFGLIIPAQSSVKVRTDSRAPTSTNPFATGI